MHTKTAYLNGFTKKQQIDFNMGSLRHNLRNIRSMNKSSIDCDNKVHINKNKTKYLHSRRGDQIDLENSILAKKIKDIICSRDNKKYHSEYHKYSKSLNGFIKKDNQRLIDVENTKFVDRLQLQKPTYQTKKILKEWEELQYVEKQQSKFQFHIVQSPSLYMKSHLRRNSSINASMIKGADYTKKAVLGGKTWQIKIYESKQEIRIIGDIITKGKQDKDHERQVKLIQIPIEEGKDFLRKHCNGKLKNLVNFLSSDPADETLFLISPGDKKPKFSQQANPEQRHIHIQKKKYSTPRQKFNNPPKHILPNDLGKFNSNNATNANTPSTATNYTHSAITAKDSKKNKLEPIRRTNEGQIKKQVPANKQVQAKEKNKSVDNFDMPQLSKTKSELQKQNKKGAQDKQEAKNKQESKDQEEEIEIQQKTKSEEKVQPKQQAEENYQESFEQSKSKVPASEKISQLKIEQSQQKNEQIVKKEQKKQGDLQQDNKANKIQQNLQQKSIQNIKEEMKEQVFNYQKNIQKLNASDQNNQTKVIQQDKKNDQTPIDKNKKQKINQEKKEEQIIQQ